VASTSNASRIRDAGAVPAAGLRRRRAQLIGSAGAESGGVARTAAAAAAEELVVTHCEERVRAVVD
jgi:hypothetical protein